MYVKLVLLTVFVYSFLNKVTVEAFFLINTFYKNKIKKSNIIKLHKYFYLFAYSSVSSFTVILTVVFVRVRLQYKT